jgi:hypothetical protein
LRDSYLLGGIYMRDRLWLTVPQAVVLEETRNLELALSLTEDDPDLRPIIANRLTARPLVIPLEDDSDEEAKLEARRQFHQAKNALSDTSRYLQAQERVQRRLIAGVTTKASRLPGGRYEVIDPVEFTTVELRDVNAVSKRTGSVSLYDLRINLVEYVKDLTGKPIEAGTTSLFRESADGGGASSEAAERWVYTGDPVPDLLRWAQSRWGDNPEKLPNRAQLLRIFRDDFGHVRGVNEHTMREVRRQLAPERARRGGAPMHRR